MWSISFWIRYNDRFYILDPLAHDNIALVFISKLENFLLEILLNCSVFLNWTDNIMYVAKFHSHKTQINLNLCDQTEIFVYDIVSHELIRNISVRSYAPFGGYTSIKN